VVVFVEDERGKRVLSENLRQVWSLAERLARARRACVGKHIARRYALVSRSALPALRALAASDAEPSSLERDLVELVREAGPLTSQELRRLLGLGDARAVKRALERLQAELVLTQAGEAPQEQGWDANVYDLVERRFPLRRLPQPIVARRQLVEVVLRAAGEVSAADVAAALPLTRREAERELELITKNGDARRVDETLYAPAA
jgi:predicted ArsR family transcriptional regulator